ncbi:helix-turn-helix domain-containing protein [Paenibacillus sp. NPDC057934]|uniref:helix-turn-helix domain-containing protein n=1 Tax=Paenibacillus sp. NPDC057934 TaxID=3346282 RepID=UPI0036DF8FB5
MNELIPYLTTKEDLSKLSNLDFGGIHKFIREKANEFNPGKFTVNSLSEMVGVSPSTISKVETGKQKKLSSDILDKISRKMSVPIEVFSPAYYKTETPKPFTICGITSNVQNFDVLDPSYRIQLSLNAYSPSGVLYKELDEIVPLSVLESEEFIWEVEQLIQKIKIRRETWSKKRSSLEEMNEWSKAGGTKND